MNPRPSLPPPPAHDILENQNLIKFKKRKQKQKHPKKKHLRYHFLHMWTLNDNHMMYGSRDTEHDRQNFLSFWAIFVLLTHWQP